MTSVELRRLFLDFFMKRQHEVIESSKVIPIDDPSLLFTNAGMNQFKNIFLGLEKPEFKRVCSIQKCIRVSGKHNDLEDVGKDGSHHTFFEMLGNWSFGDYYKKEAVEWAWEFVTKELALPEENLWVSIYKDDEETYEIWMNIIRVDEDRIIRLGDIEKGDEENFWSMGETGPCGPCAEIYYDYVPYKNKNFQKAYDSGEIAELWNLVFMEFNRQPGGKLVPLPAKNIDTGLGLERTLAVLQGVTSDYETDLFIPLVKKLEEISEVPYNDQKGLVSYQVITDHIRSLVFAIADGAVPSNEGRGYVLRRILRRAVRHGKLLGLNKPFLYQLIDPLIKKMKDTYHELGERMDIIKKIIVSEEELFMRTLDRGLSEFDKTVKRLKESDLMVFPGREAFILHDTYGFPLDLTQIMAAEKGLTVNKRDFEKEMARQRERAHKESRFQRAYEHGEWVTFQNYVKTVFTGYKHMKQDSMKLIKYRMKDNKVFLVFDKTPFYGEAGGQVADTGFIEGEGIRIKIDDVQRMGDIYIHIGMIEEGKIGDIPYTGLIDSVRRKRIMANHTATHLLHYALRKVLGSHAIQSGSLVTPKKLRFDFNHYNPLTTEELDKIEEIVNETVHKNLPVEAFDNIPIEEAKSMGATALFGEKYGKRVRVIQIDDISNELCGGTHTERTGDIGFFKIVKESSISSGVRRIEAVTKMDSFHLIKENETLLRSVSDLLHTAPDGILDNLKRLQDKIRDLEKRIKKETKRDIDSLFDSEKTAFKAGKYNLVLLRLTDCPQDELREISDRIKSKLKMGITLITSVNDNRLTFVLSVTKDAIKSGLHAGKLLEEIAPIMGGSGGGRPHLAQGGGGKSRNIEKAFNKLKELLSEKH